MAGELTIANMGDALVAETVTGDFEVKAHEVGSFLDHPVIKAGYLGSINGTSSAVLSKSVAGLGGYDPLASTAEGVAPSNSTFALDKLSVTVSKQSKVYAENSDIVQALLAGRLQTSDFVADAFASYQARLMDMIANVIDGYSSPVGDVAAGLDAPTVIAAGTAAKLANMKGPYMLLLHTYQWGQLALDLGISIGGVIQWQAATAEMVALKGEAYQGSWLGMDIFVSNRVVTSDASAGRAGALLGTFANLHGGSGSSIVWGDGTFVNTLPTQINIAGKVLFGLDRQELKGSTSYASHSMLGVDVGQAGITVKSINAASA